MAGPNAQASPGDPVMVDDKTGKALVAGGFATEIESASIAPPEKAQMAKAKVKRGKK